MTQTKSIEQSLLDIFGGNPYHAAARLSEKGEIYYLTQEIPLTEDLVKAHLDGKMALGCYQLLQGANNVRWLGWDIDSTDMLVAQGYATKILSHLEDVPHAIEFSGRRGYHILIFLMRPMAASQAKAFTEWVRDAENLRASGDTHVECFPKQAQLTKSRTKGNLLKLPLGEHPSTKNRSKFVNPSDGWENGSSLDPIEVLSRRTDPNRLLAMIAKAPQTEEQLVDLIAKYWTEGERHNISLYVCGFLAQEGWGYEQTVEFITKVVQKTGDTQLDNRLQTVKTTFERFHEGKGVRGRQGLGELFTTIDMHAFTELVAAFRAPDTVMQIDDIRYLSKPKLELARLAAHTIWSILNDNGGRIFQNEQNVAYWYDPDSHAVTQEGTEFWDTLLNKAFGLNPRDQFSKLITMEIRLRIIRESPILAIYNRTFWSEADGRLFINLGGPEVFIIIDEDHIERSYNGECGLMFKTNSSGKYLTPDFDAERTDAWDRLVNDLSFTTSTEAPAHPEEQRELLKAWILAFFFQEMMPTKPILSLLGVPGSGKTTAIRRILRILEDPNADVLGVPTDKQDAFRATIEKHRLIVIDNLEKSGVGWMVDLLNKLATGNHIEIRELYRTNATHLIAPDCFVALTAVNIPFSDETLFSRMLVLEMQRLSEPMPEHVLQNTIREFGPAIWADLMRKLGKVVAILRSKPKVRPPTKSRLVDFTVFCEKIKACDVVRSKELSSGLLAMVDSQLHQLRQSSQAVFLLEEWLTLKPQEAAEWRTVEQIYSVLSSMAQARRLTFQWKNSAALQRHLSTLESRLKADFAAEIKMEESPQTGRETMRIRFKNMLI